jgi:hypothetical protein
MVSGFLIPGGILRVPNEISDQVLCSDGQWPRDSTGNCIREAIEYLEYGKDNYWTGDKTVDQTIKVAFRIFQHAIPGCQALFAFDNASNHCTYAPNALAIYRINLNLGGKQPKMRDGFIQSKGRPQAMVFPKDYPDHSLRGVTVARRDNVGWGNNEYYLYNVYNSTRNRE